ncbi:hypothetical protein [Microbacterium maritypicum]|uniref:hypothetical protein n=1 Tax=Microbacterium maritypicum TaxID=33918 RepID=UPI00041937A2|nr:hypothetical protein [Microbacterium liquefaciens]
MTVVERPLFGKVDIERVPSWSDYTTLESNPTAVSTGSAAAFGTRFGWTRTWVANGAENVLPFGTLARFTSPESGTVAGRGIDSYGNQDVAPTIEAQGSDVIFSGPTVTPGETITVSRWVRMNVPTPGYIVGVRFHNGTGAWIGGTSFGAYTGAGSGTAWVKPTWTGVVPAGATRYSVTVRVASVTVSATTFMDVSGLMTHKGAPSGPVSLAKATRCSITRGGSRTGLGIKTDVGLMSFTLHNDQDPLSGGVFEPGQVVRAVIPGKSDQVIYTHDFDTYAATSWPAQQVYSHGFEGFTEATYPAGEVAYSEGFESNTGGWVANGTTFLLDNAGTARTGIKALSVSYNTATSVTRVVNGLVVGRSYTFSAWARPLNSGRSARIGVTGISNSADVAIPASTYGNVSYTFTATSTSHELRLTNVGSGGFSWDDVTLTGAAYTTGTNAMDGWLGTNSNVRARTGTRSAAYGSGQSKTFTGLLVGHPYQLAGYYWNTATSAWTQVTQNTTGAATNSFIINAPNASHWDDFTLTRTAWTQVTNNGLDSWTGLTGITPLNAHSGTYAGSTSTTTGVKTVTRNFTGLAPGGWYRVEGWVKGNATTLVSIEAGGGSSAAVALATANTYEKRVYEFKARTATEAIAFKLNQVAAGNSYLDDIQVTRFYPATPIFTGTVTDVSSTYPFKKSTGEKRTSVVVTVSDAVKIHGTTPRYGAMIGAPYYETFEQRIARLSSSALAPIESPPVGAPKVVYSF